MKRPRPRLRRSSYVVLGAIAACGPPPSPLPPAAPERIAIAIGELGKSGARLVAIDEHGDRQLDLIAPAAGFARDFDPAISPDCRWIAFVSNRAKGGDLTSVWIAPLAAEAQAVALTHDAVDGHPAWTRDGRAIVFERSVGDHFELFRVAVDHGRATGEPEQLTHGTENARTPTIAADGTIIYARGTAEHSHLEMRAPDGTISSFTDGPLDASPALSPDDTTVAFARPLEHKGLVDSDLWLLRRGEKDPIQVADTPLTDEATPVWSRDGRFLFATSVLRTADGTMLFSSVIEVDLREHKRVARILEDRTGPTVRLTPAISCAPLDATALRSDPEYLVRLAQIVGRALAEQKRK